MPNFNRNMMATYRSSFPVPAHSILMPSSLNLSVTPGNFIDIEFEDNGTFLVKKGPQDIPSPDIDTYNYLVNAPIAGFAGHYEVSISDLTVTQGSISSGTSLYWDASAGGRVWHPVTEYDRYRMFCGENQLFVEIDFNLTIRDRARALTPDTTAVTVEFFD